MERRQRRQDKGTRRIAELNRQKQLIDAEIEKEVEALERDEFGNLIKDALAQFEVQLDKLEPLFNLRAGESPHESWAQHLIELKEFNEKYLALQQRVLNAVKEWLLGDITNGLMSDLYNTSTGTLGFEDWPLENDQKVRDSIGPNWPTYLEEFVSQYDEGDSDAIRKKRLDTQEFRNHLKNILILSVIADHSKPKDMSQKIIAELTEKSPSKISLDVFMAKQILLESWLKESMRDCGRLEFVIPTVGVAPVTGSSKSLDDNYSRWPRDGFGYCVLRDTDTMKMAVILLHILDGSLSERRELMGEFVGRLHVVGNETKLAQQLPQQYSSMPVAHLISTGNYYETELVLHSRLDEYIENGGKILRTNISRSLDDLFAVV